MLEEINNLNLNKEIIIRKNTEENFKIIFEKEFKEPYYNYKNPFSKYKKINENDRIWIYLDDNNLIQGPFTGIEMNYWYKNSFFHNKLLIGLIDKKFLISINEFLKIIN